MAGLMVVGNGKMYTELWSVEPARGHSNPNFKKCACQTGFWLTV